MERHRNVALLTNFIPFYRVKMLEALGAKLGRLRVFVSVEMEADRAWSVNWGRLDVKVLRSLTLHRKFQNTHGYQDHSFVHISYNLLPQLQRFRPDVILSAELGIRSMLAALYRSIHPRSRLIVWATLSERTEEGRGRLRAVVRRILVRRTDAFIVNGQSGARYIASLGATPGKIRVVHQTVDTFAFRRETPLDLDQNDELLLLYTGQLIQRKGMVPFLERLAAWCTQHLERRIHLRVIGSGPEEAALRSFGLPENLKLVLHPSMSHEELPKYYRSSHIYVYPTMADEWGLVVNEALAAGLPILGSRHSQAVDELVREGVNGWRFDSVDREDTMQALDRALLSSTEQLREMSANAQQSIASTTPETVADRIASLVAEISQWPSGEDAQVSNGAVDRA